MMAPHRTTVVGVFEDRQKADNAVNELREAGFRDDQIGVAMRGDDAISGTAADTADEGSHAGSGAAAGALTGLGLGALAGLGVLSGIIPIVGPAIAGGTLGILLTNAAAGAGLGGLAGALIGGGMSEEEATYYQGEFEAGRAIVTVTADGRADEAATILRRHDAYDMNMRTSPAAGQGAMSSSTPSDASAPDDSTPADATSAATTPAAAGATPSAGHAASHAAGDAGDTIQVKEERLHAEKHPVEAGEVRVHKEVQTEHQSIDVPVQREEVVIERTPVHGQAASEGVVDTGDVGEGGEVRIPVRQEHIDVSKTPVVTEEVKVGKRTVQDTEHVADEVRKEEVRVEQKGDVDVHTRGDAGRE